MDTSSDNFENVYGKSGPENEGKYYEGYLEKKEKKWQRYWCVLKHQNLYFFKDVNTQIKENYIGYCHLDSDIHVEIIKSKKDKYEWTIKTKIGKVALRTEVASLRDGWLNGINMSIKHEKPNTVSHILPGSGPVSPTHSAGSGQAHHSPSRKESTAGRKESIQYTAMTDEQLRSFQLMDSSLQKDSFVDVSRQEVKEELNCLNANKNWYMPSYRREETENRLKNLVNGTFIVRDYIDSRTNANKGYVISLKDETSYIRHHRIEKRDDVLVLKGYELKSFKTLNELLEFFIMSQKKKLGLIPYDPNKPVSPPQLPASTGYVSMAGPVNGSRHIPAQRSQSFQHRRLPEPPPQQVGRASSVRDHHIPHRQVNVQPSYMQMEQQTPHTSQHHDPYIQMTQSPPVQKSPDQSYVNMSPGRRTPNTLSSYENIEESPYQNTGINSVDLEEPPPILPPKKRAASLPVIPPYVNLPHGSMGRVQPSSGSYVNPIDDRNYMNNQVRPGR